MRQTVTFVSLIILALVVGVGSAWFALQPETPIQALRLGAWQAWPDAGTKNDDPYSLARQARTGDWALGSGEGLALLALQDSNGDTLSGTCQYRIVGQTPPARLWTLELAGADGSRLSPTSGGRALSSTELLRDGNGWFEIAIAPTPQPGNWISSENARNMRLVTRLYGTSLRSLTGATEFSMPEIDKIGCP